MSHIQSVFVALQIFVAAFEVAAAFVGAAVEIRSAFVVAAVEIPSAFVGAVAGTVSALLQKIFHSLPIYPVLSVAVHPVAVN